MGRITKWVIFAVVLLCLLAVVFFLVAPPPKLPPLPFDASNYVATIRIKYFTPKTNGSVKDRLVSSLRSWNEDLEFRNPDPHKWSFGPSGIGNSSIMGYLNQSMSISGNTYYLSQSVSPGTFLFGQTNTLDGAQWVAAVEAALQSPATQALNLKTRSMEAGGLVLFRFPEQRAVLVLTQSEAAEFRRTNSMRIELLPPEPARPPAGTN